MRYTSKHPAKPSGRVLMRVFFADMNYVSAVYAVVVGIIAIDWFFRARKEYRGQRDRHEAAQEAVRKASIVSFRKDGAAMAGKTDVS